MLPELFEPEEVSVEIVITTDEYLVIHIEPLWMMINFVSLQSYPGHEAKCLVEVFEDELLVDGVSVLHHGPSLQGKK